MGVLVILCACAGLTLLVRWVARRRRLAELAKNVPTLAGDVPFIGHFFIILNLVKKMLRSTRMAEEVGAISKAWIRPSQLNFIVQDPQLALKLMNICITKTHNTDFITAWIGQGLVTCNAERWKVTRKLLNPAFNQRILNGFMKVFNEQAKDLVEALRDHEGQGAFDQSPYLVNASLETICRTAIPVNDGDEKVVDDAYIRTVHRIMELFTRRFKNIWMHPECLYKLTSTSREEAKVAKTLKAFSADALKHKRKIASSEARAPGNRFKTFLDLIVQLGDEGSFTDSEIQDELDTMILAGHDTSANVLSFALMLMRTHPDIQDRAYSEIKEVFGDDDRDVTKDDLPELKYLEAILKETLRVYPICPFMARTADVDTTVDNMTIPAGSEVLVNVTGLHRHVSWGDPNVFRPGRWMDPATLPQLPVYSGFGLGRRTCIGRAYAMMAMKTTLVHILRRYQIYGASDIPVKTKFDIVVRPVVGHLIEIKKR